MNRSILSRLKQLVDPPLHPGEGTCTLSPAEHESVHALFEVLTCDSEVEPARLRAWVDSRTGAIAGLGAEYRRGIQLLEDHTKRRWPARRFATLRVEERDLVLRAILRRYPHPLEGSLWARRLRLTSENLDVVLARRPARRFRRHVVRDLLGYYYSSERGWAVVGYRSFRGRSEAELVEGVVIGFSVEDGQVVLELSDGTIEPLDPRTLEVDEARGLSLRVKAGRQRATFSRSIYPAFAELLDDDGGGTVLKIGSDRVAVLR